MKPLNRKSYGSIPHLLGSKLGATDKYVHEGQHRIMTEKTRDKHDHVIVNEKYDGSNDLYMAWSRKKSTNLQLKYNVKQSK